MIQNTVPTRSPKENPPNAVLSIPYVKAPSVATAILRLSPSEKRFSKDKKSSFLNEKTNAFSFNFEKIKRNKITVVYPKKSGIFFVKRAKITPPK